MSVAESLESFLLNAEARTGQKTVKTWAKIKKRVREGGIIFFTPSKGFKGKREY